MRVRGLSPRLRGNPSRRGLHRRDARSIPAPTGKPKDQPEALPLLEVYPRAYGETALVAGIMSTHVGLSPRLRGNRLRLRLSNPKAGSIPAPTGKPYPASIGTAAYWVYPRAYGETTKFFTDTIPGVGLSPRLRGNPVKVVFPPGDGGSIPAPTGKPGRWRTPSRPGAVYPRAYGETVSCCEAARSGSGLSPRLRGNQHGALVAENGLRSIPAPTGKPRCPPRRT